MEAGDIVMVVESDKADMDVEAFESGFLAKILVPQVCSLRRSHLVLNLYRIIRSFESSSKISIAGIAISYCSNAPEL